MKLKKIISQDNYCLVLQFSNNVIRTVDYSEKSEEWLASANHDLISIAENFDTAYIDDAGNLAFDCDGNHLYFTASQIFDSAEKMRGKRPTSTKKIVKPGPRNSAPATIKKRDSLGSIPMSEVMKMKSDDMQFEGKWKDFLGNIPWNFRMVITSAPGDGKSTFALSLASYLWNNFRNRGTVCYYSSEEDEPRLRAKQIRIDPKANFLTNCSLRTYEDLIKRIDIDKPQFIFIDSVQEFGMDYSHVFDLCQRYPNKGIAMICQHTKNGKMRGSRRIEHKGDITITSIDKGHFETIKNRFSDLSDIVIFKSKKQPKK